MSRGFRSLIVAALRIDNNVIGEIVLCSVRPGAFNAKHLEIAAEVANQTAIAIHHSQMLEAEKRARGHGNDARGEYGLGARWSLRTM